VLHRYRVRREIGTGLIVWVNPKKIQYYAGSNLPYTQSIRSIVWRLETAVPLISRYTAWIHKSIYSLEPFSIKDRLLRNLIPIESEPRYTKILNYIQNLDNLEESLWYRDIVQQIKDNGVAHHKNFELKSEADVLNFFEGYVRDLVESMNESGYDDTKAVDYGTALIGSDGSILKTAAGNHRFSFARILGVSLVPLEILGAHEFWMQKMEIDGDIEALASGIRRVEYINSESSSDEVATP